MLDEIGGKVVMVSDQEKALDFYVNKLGLEKKVDMQFGESRWLEVAPKNSKSTIALMEPSPNNLPPHEIEMAKKSIGTPTGLWFFSNNIQETFDSLTSKGVSITKPEVQDWGGIVSSVKDEDGNEFKIIASPKDEN